MNRMFVLLALQLHCLVLVGQESASNESWPWFRGYNRDGSVATSVPLARTWPVGGPPVLWTWDIPFGWVHSHQRFGFSSPVVGGGRAFMYVTGGEGPAPENWKKPLKDRVLFECFVALDVATGTVLWERRFPRQDFRKFNDAATPVIYQDALFAVGKGGVVRCFAVSDGKTVWECTLPDSKLTRRSASPVLAGDVLVVAGQKGLHGIDRKSGTLLWQSKPVVFNQTPALWHHDGKMLVVVADTKGVHIIDSQTGAVFHRYVSTERGGFPVDGKFLASVLVRDQTLYVASRHRYRERSVWHSEATKHRGIVKDYSRLHALAFIDGSLVEQFRIDTLGQVGIALGPDRIVGSSALGLSGHDYRGKQRYWHIDYRRIGEDFSAPIIADGLIVSCSAFGLALFDLQTGEQLAYHPSPKLDIGSHDRGAFTTPALAGGRLFWRHARSLVCYDLRQ